MANDKEKSDAIKDFEKQFAEESKYNDLRKETSRNRAVLDHRKSVAELERQKQDEEDLEIFYNANFGIQSKEQIEIIVKENQEYMAAAKNRMEFIMPDDPSGEVMGFNQMVPFFRKNLIFIGAQTGFGKSTAAANIAFHMLMQKNPVTGESTKTLILSNEERKEDVYNRITCLLNGWSYTNHSKFTDKQVEIFSRAIPTLSTRVTVIDNIHEGGHGATSTLEGIEAIFENLMRNKIYYNAVIIDYYQNVITSLKNPKLTDYEVQGRLARLLDKYKNLYPAPIILLGQVNPPDENGNPIFYWRIQGRKLIMTVCTAAIEMVVDKKKKLTTWHWWKSRFAEALGEQVQTGFQDGRFVPYTQAFQQKIRDEADRRAKALTDRLANEKVGAQSGLQDVFEKKVELHVVKDEKNE